MWRFSERGPKNLTFKKTRRDVTEYHESKIKALPLLLLSHSRTQKKKVLLCTIACSSARQVTRWYDSTLTLAMPYACLLLKGIIICLKLLPYCNFVSTRPSTFSISLLLLSWIFQIGVKDYFQQYCFWIIIFKE